MRALGPKTLLRSALALTLFALVPACGGEDAGPEPVSKPPPLPTFPYPLDNVLRLNHVQTKGSHNSYHIKPDNEAPEWAYTHAPLDVQLQSQGVRTVELDTSFNDADLVFEVFHIPFLDEGTTCRRFTDCLATMKAWSDAFPAHHTLFVQIEPKDGFIPETADDYFERFEKEILSVWPRERIITPDDVKRDAASLREAVTTTGFPLLGEGRARILFFMDEHGKHRNHYTHGGSDLDGRLMFVASDAGQAMPYDALYILNDPVADAQAIKDAVAAGFLVRTRADGDNKEPLAGDTTKRDAALAGGAHMVSTDYPQPVAGVDYVVEIPDGAPSRCNPVVAPPECTAEAIEDPAFMKAP